MRVTEPWRSRLYIAAGVLLSATVALAPELWMKVTAAAVGLAILIVGHSMQYLSRRKRRQQFTVLRGNFLALPASSPGLNTITSLIMVGMFTSLSALQQDDAGETDRVLAGMAIATAAITGAQVLLAWPPFYVALIPQGVQWKSALHRRLVPWEALAPGGPPAPAPQTERVTLAVTRPEAVTSKGPKFLVGPMVRPVVGGQFDVHPRLMAAAIRWYVDHPEDRPAIGTQEEHERLLAALGELGELAARRA